MNILLLCDEAGAENRKTASDLAAWAEKKGHSIQTLYADSLDLKPCMGCFGCWIKTPGICLIRKDGGDEVLKAFAGADLVLAVGKIPFGSFSLPLKRVFDRMLPVLMPYFRIFRGEMHHVLRYRKQPCLLHVSRGSHSPEEAATFRELCLSHCDNVGSKRSEKPFHHEGDTAGLIAWVEGELAS